MRFVQTLSLVLVVFIAGCAHPTYVETKSPSSATVVISNQSRGYINAMTYENPQTCAGSLVLGKLHNPFETRAHSLPSNRVITLSLGAFGISSTAYSSWCEPIFISTKFVAGHSYRITFVADDQKKMCGLVVTDVTTNQPAKTVSRNGKGGLFPGTMTGSSTCTPINPMPL